jgi:hypothetical protein
VTSFLFRLHPVDMVYAGPTFWPRSSRGSSGVLPEIHCGCA